MAPISVTGTLVTPEGLMPDGYITVEEGRIIDMGQGEPEQGGVVSEGGLVAPGLIDLHVHGGNGHSVMDASRRSLDAISRHLSRGGVTSYLATTYSSPHKGILKAAAAVKKLMDRRSPGAKVAGIHMEGPYINPERRGAQPEESIRPPDISELEEIRDLVGDALRIVSLAPEVRGGLKAVRWLYERGVTASAGHSNATYEEMMRAVESGLTHVAHLYNGMRGFHHRDPGIVGAALADPRVTVELIADGHHVHPAALELSVRIKGVERAVLVSDAISPSGLQDGDHRLGERMVHVRDGLCLLEDGVIAGSTIRLNQAVGLMVREAGFTLPEAVRMASTTPAGILGLDRKGILAPGMDADVTVLDDEFRVQLTMVDGRVVHRDS